MYSFKEEKVFLDYPNNFEIHDKNSGKDQNIQYRRYIKDKAIVCFPSNLYTKHVIFTNLGSVCIKRIILLFIELIT